MDKTYYTPTDVAKETGLKKSTVARWFAQGRVNGAIKIGIGRRGGRWYAEAEGIGECLTTHGWVGKSIFTTQEAKGEVA
jgi:hypothetical protein